MGCVTSTTLIHHRSNHLTLSENKNANFQNTEKTNINGYFLLRRPFY